MHTVECCNLKNMIAECHYETKALLDLQEINIVQALNRPLIEHGIICELIFF